MVFLAVSQIAQVDRRSEHSIYDHGVFDPSANDGAFPKIRCIPEKKFARRFAAKRKRNAVKG